MKDRWGVIVTDVQGDFTEFMNGSLAVPDTGAGYVQEVEKATRRLKEAGLVIFGTQDWHPAGHISFASNHPGKAPFDSIIVNGRAQTLWPPHCVQGTENARVLIDNNLFLAIVRKAQNPAFDSYSAFQDDGGAKTELDAMLRTNEITRLLIYGLATDYCVRASAIDAIAAGYQATVAKALSRGFAPLTAARALDEMRRKGVRLIETPEEIRGVSDPSGRKD
jgi:nicotinamidase/pyrazinamidase